MSRGTLPDQDARDDTPVNVQGPGREARRVLLRPPLLALHAFAVVAVAFTVVMGLWQLGVYDAQQEHERADEQGAPPVPLDDALGPDAPLGDAGNRPVEADGRFGPADQQFWVSGRTDGGRDGYWLVAPYLVGEGEDALLVVRGWADDKGPLPALPETPRLEAVLQQSEESGSALSADRTTDAVSVPMLANELPYDLYSGFAIQTGPQPPGSLAAVPPPDPEVSWTVGLRNLVYAIQWWVFGAFAVVFWLRICRDLVRDARNGRDDASGPQVA